MRWDTTATIIGIVDPLNMQEQKRPLCGRFSLVASNIHMVFQLLQ